MSQFPEYLESELKDVDEAILAASRDEIDDLSGLLDSLRAAIKQYASDRVNETSVEYLSKLGKLGAEFSDAVYELNKLKAVVQDVIGQSCEDWCESVMGEGADCTCHVGRLKAALEP